MTYGDKKKKIIDYDQLRFKLNHRIKRFPKLKRILLKAELFKRGKPHPLHGKLLTERQLATKLKVSKRTLNRWRKDKKMPYFELKTICSNGKPCIRIRYSAEQVRRWLIVRMHLKEYNKISNERFQEYQNS